MVNSLLKTPGSWTLTLCIVVQSWGTSLCFHTTPYRICSPAAEHAESLTKRADSKGGGWKRPGRRCGGRTFYGGSKIVGRSTLIFDDAILPSFGKSAEVDVLILIEHS